MSGEWAKNQTGCNIPCTGDKNTVCGGKGALNVFEAWANSKPSVSSSATSSAGAVKTTGAGTSATPK